MDSRRIERLAGAEKELNELQRKARVLKMKNKILKQASAYFACENLSTK